MSRVRRHGVRPSAEYWYRHRSDIERAFNKLKQHRAVATRYDKRDYVWPGTVGVAIRIWLRDPSHDPQDSA